MSDPVTLFYVVTAVGAGVTAYSAHQEGVIASNEAKRQADQAELSARDQELQRRNRLMKVLASRTVDAASGGTLLEGTPLALINADFAAANLDSMNIDANRAATVSTLRARSSNARLMGRINAGASLLQGASQLASIKASQKAPKTAKRTGPP